MIRRAIVYRDTKGNCRGVELTGRLLWALMELHAAGARGCTPIETPGPRWSHYVHELRRQGFPIETVREPHGGAFPGHHARYVLHCSLRIEPLEYGEDAA